MNPIEQVKKTFGEYLPENSNIDLELLPVFIRDTLNFYLVPKNVNTPISILILNLLVKCAQIVAHNRVQYQLKTEKKLFPVNVYGIVFADSSAGKGRSLNHIDSGLLEYFFEQFDKQEYFYMAQGIEDRENQAKKLYPKNEAARLKYLAETEPRALIRRFGDATVPGFSAIREAFLNAGFGAPFVLIPEFGDYITSQDQSKESFISALTEVFDAGILEAKLIKSENTKTTAGIPSNALLQSSPFNLTEGKGYEKIKIMFGTGIGRRGFVCYPNVEEIPVPAKNIDIFEEVKKETENAIAANESLDYLKIFYEYAFDDSKKQTVVCVTDEATLIYGIYRKYCERRCFNMKDKALKAEIDGRSWKMIKLAGVLSYFNNTEVIEITKENIFHAVYLTEIFGMHFERFCNVKNETDNQKMFDFFMQNKNRWFNKTELREQKFVSDRNFKNWLEQNMPLCEEMAENNGYILIYEKYGTNGEKWKLVSKDVEIPEKIEIPLSITKQKGSEIKAFQDEIVVEFSELHKIVNSETSYSFGKFKNKERKIANCIGQANMICYDIDSGLTIKEVQEILQEYKHLITTTKSHQKSKNDFVCDRFRVFLPTTDALPHDNKKYKTILKNIAAEFGLTIDAPVVEVARYFFGNKGGEAYYNEGTKLINWSLYENEPEEEKKERRRMPDVKTAKYKGAPMAEVLGTDEALRRYEFYDPLKGCVKGNVDNFFRRISLWLRDAGISQGDKEKELLWLYELSPISDRRDKIKENIRRLARN